MEESKTRGLAERFPGALAMEGLASMKRSLLTTSGEDLDDTTPKPIAIMYYRNVLAKRTSGAAARELLNLCSCIDALVRGRPAAAMDILVQRVKAQEAVAHGSSWGVAQHMEIPYSEAATLAARSEWTKPGKNKWKNDKGGSGKDGRKDDKKDKGNGGDTK